MEIRKFIENDGKNVKELILSILEKEYPFDRKAYSDTDLENIAQTYGGPKDTFFVAGEGEEIIGTAGIKKDTEETALLRRVFVKPTERKKGLGSRLLDETIKFCKEQGYKHMVFRTTNRMISAIELCKKKGFKEEEKLDIGGFSIHKFVLNLTDQS